MVDFYCPFAGEEGSCKYARGYEVLRLWGEKTISSDVMGRYSCNVLKHLEKEDVSCAFILQLNLLETIALTSQKASAILRRQ